MSSASSFLEIPSGFRDSSSSHRPNNISRSSSYSHRRSNFNTERDDETSDPSTKIPARGPGVRIGGRPSTTTSPRQTRSSGLNRSPLSLTRSKGNNTSPIPRSIISSGASTSSYGPGIMSDDDQHRLRNTIVETVNENSMSNDRAEVVRKLVTDLTERCDDLSRVVTELQNKLKMRLYQNEKLAASVKVASLRLEDQRAHVSDQRERRVPRFNGLAESADQETQDVIKRLPNIEKKLNEIDRSYEKERQKALALERYLQWRTTRWYIRAHRYLRGERPLNWKDKSAHRRQMIIMTLIWSGGVFTAVSVVIIALLLLRAYLA